MKVVAILRYTFLETSNISKVMFSQIRPQTFVLLLHGRSASLRALMQI